MRIAFHDPLGDFLLALTNFAVKPLRRVVPGLWGYDLASLVAAWLVELLTIAAKFVLLGHGAALIGELGGIALLSLLGLLVLCVRLLIAVVIVGAVLSWVQPYHWLNKLAGALSRPFLRPFRRIIPLVGNVDLSPLVLILLLQVVLMMLGRIAIGLV